MRAMTFLMFLLSRAELIGSRGRARKYSKPEPHNSDYDWAIFTDDKALQKKCLAACQKIVDEQEALVITVSPHHVKIERPWKLIPRVCGFTLHNAIEGIDISVVPVIRRTITHEAWELIEKRGFDKHEAWKAMNAKYGLDPN